MLACHTCLAAPAPQIDLFDPEFDYEAYQPEPDEFIPGFDDLDEVRQATGGSAANAP